MKRIERAANTSADFQLRHWEDTWQGWNLATIDAAIRWEGILPLARRAFPPKSKLLEAGCGTGKYCVALDRLGYRVTGIDFAQSGLDVMHRIAPALEGVLGSVLDMPFPSASFDGALSLGVVEHFEEGPEKAIQELHRVLRPGGQLLLTVPYHNQLHRWFPEHGARPEGLAAAVFYQYLYTRDEMTAHLERAGFKVTRVEFLAKQLGLSEFTSRSEPEGAAAAPVSSTAKQCAAGSEAPQPGTLVRLKRVIKGATPKLAFALRDIQLTTIEGVLPGPVCAHTIAFIATRT